jgi:transcriptional regulator with XRE-family HTH domain
MTNISALLREGMTRTTKSKSALAREVGVSPQYISLISRGMRLPRSPILLDAIAKALGIPPAKMTEAFLLDFTAREALLASQRRSRYATTAPDDPTPSPIVKVEKVRPPKARKVKPTPSSRSRKASS